jgi:hypothetical protein
MSATVHRSSALVWARRNLFRSPLDGVLTVVFGAISVWLIYKTLSFVFVTGRWDIIRVNLRLLMIGRFPDVHVLRLAVTVVALGAWGGFLAGFIRARQVRSRTCTRHGRVDRGQDRRHRRASLAARRRGAAPALLSSTSGPWIMVGLAIVAAVSDD